MSATLNLTLDADALREATTQALLGALTPEVRERVLQQAITAMLTPDRTYGSKTSPLEQAFQLAVSGSVNQIAREMVAADETLRGKLSDLLRATADKVLASDVDKLAERMADALVSSMRRD